jgi:hypothetical protein
MPAGIFLKLFWEKDFRFISPAVDHQLFAYMMYSRRVGLAADFFQHLCA